MTVANDYESDEMASVDTVRDGSEAVNDVLVVSDRMIRIGHPDESLPRRRCG